MSHLWLLACCQGQSKKGQFPRVMCRLQYYKKQMFCSFSSFLQFSSFHVIFHTQAFWQSMSLSFSQSMREKNTPSVHLSACLAAHPSINPSTHPTIHPSNNFRWAKLCFLYTGLLVQSTKILWLGLVYWLYCLLKNIFCYMTPFYG